MLPIEDTEDFKDFHKRVGEGSEYIVVRRINDYDLYLFENGARCCPMSRFGEGPPDDPERLYKARKAFYSVRLQQTREDYEALRRELTDAAQYYSRASVPMPDTTEEVAELKRLKSAMVEYERAFDEFTAPEQRQKEEWERDERRRQSINQGAAIRLLRQLESI